MEGGKLGHVRIFFLPCDVKPQSADQTQQNVYRRLNPTNASQYRRLWVSVTPAVRHGLILSGGRAVPELET